jgi:nucleotide-binding universal stress UspA family protein
MTEEDAAARRLLRRAAAIADSYGVHVVPRVVHARDAARSIVEESEERSTELVVIGAPKRRRAAVGPTVAHVLKHASCRVLVISAAPDAAIVEGDVAA